MFEFLDDIINQLLFFNIFLFQNRNLLLHLFFFNFKIFNLFS